MSDRIRAAVEEHVESGALPGSPGGSRGTARSAAASSGPATPEGAGDPVRPDTLFRISSTTKPVTAVVAMTLVDDGTLSLDDPVERWLPELADRQVLVDPEGDLTHTVPANRPILVQDVLEFRLGLGYDFSGAPTPVLDALAQAGCPHGSAGATGQPRPGRVDGDVRAAAADVPAGRALAVQHRRRGPGRARRARLGLDVARPAARARPDPLGMHSTAFSVPPADAGPVRAAVGAR